MKQQITLEQLNELSIVNRDKYFAYSKLKGWRKNNADWDLWSIGQMIEFLDENVKCDWGVHFGKALAFAAFVNLEEKYLDGLFGKTPSNRKGELCDGLWKAVKEVFEK